MSDKVKKSLVMQGSILALAGIISKIIGFIYRIPMANIMGNTGNGLYSVAFGIYNIALTLSSYSMPLAVSKLMSERIAKKEYKNINKILSHLFLKHLLQESKEHHKQLELDIHKQLDIYKAEEKEPNPMARGMSWMKTNMKLGMNDSDATIADLLTDGCDMGIKSLYKYMNQYDDADKTSKEICEKLIAIEEKLEKDLRKYL